MWLLVQDVSQNALGLTRRGLWEGSVAIPSPREHVDFGKRFILLTRHFCILLLSHGFGRCLLMLQCLVDCDAHCLVVVLLHLERFHDVVKFGAKDYGDTLHLFVHVFRAADLASSITLGRLCQQPCDNGCGH